MGTTERALIVGAGTGLSLSLARLFRHEGMQVALAARSVERLAGIADENACRAYGCDASAPEQVERLFEQVVGDMGAPDVVVYNPSARVQGPIVELDPMAVRDALLVTCYGGFLVAQAATELMLERGSGTLLFTGASASVKGYANSSSFAMGKFALRGLCQSLARELQPRNIHVAHFVIDGGIAKRSDDGAQPDDDSLLDPDAIARTYLDIHRQQRSAWTWEVALRPWVESF